MHFILGYLDGYVQLIAIWSRINLFSIVRLFFEAF